VVVITTTKEEQQRVRLIFPTAVTTTKLPVLPARFPRNKRGVKCRVVAEVQKIGRRDREDCRRDVPG
jgi:hypothetical protein